MSVQTPESPKNREPAKPPSASSRIQSGLQAMEQSLTQLESVTRESRQNFENCRSLLTGLREWAAKLERESKAVVESCTEKEKFATERAIQAEEQWRKAWAQTQEVTKSRDSLARILEQTRFAAAKEAGAHNELQAKIQDRDNRIQEFSKRIDSLQMELKKADQERKERGSEIERKARALVQERDSRIRELMKQLERFQAALNKADQDRKFQKEEIELRTQTISRELTRERELRLAEQAEAKHLLQMARKEQQLLLGTKTRELETELERLGNMLRSKEERIKDLTARLEESEENAKVAGKKLEVLRSEKESEEMQVERLSKWFEQELVREKGLRQSIQSRVLQLEEALAQEVKLRKELEYEKARFDETQVECGRLKSALQRQEMDLERLRRLNETLNAAIAQDRDQIQIRSSMDSDYELSETKLGQA